MGLVSTVSLRLIHAAYVATLRQAWNRFSQAADAPAEYQRARLQAILRANAASEYGRRYGFDRIDSCEEYRASVPIVDYEAIEPFTMSIAKGKTGVLTSEPVKMMERSGGSTSTNKFIPFTEGLRNEFSAVTGPWLYDLFRSCPGLVGTRSYWSISPAAGRNEKTEGGLPIGFDDDTEYFGPAERWALKKMMAVPASVAHLPDMDSWRRATVMHLLKADDLGLVSIWSPSFMLPLIELIEDDLDWFLARLPRSRARGIRTGIERAGRLTGGVLWPRLACISCWTDGISGEYLPALRRFFPETPIQPKGLLATEGVVSFPLWGEKGSVVAVTGHFLEFLDLNDPGGMPLLAHELEEGGKYSPVLTTSGGFYRYHLKDIVDCVGRYRKTPLIRFRGKLDRVSDLCGEKLNAEQVSHALAMVKEQTGIEYSFAMLAPVWTSRPFYCLFIETGADDAELDRAVDIVETYLRTGHHYNYCRDLGQLGGMRAMRVANGRETYEATLREEGARAGDIKPTHLDRRRIWARAFGLETGVSSERTDTGQ